MVPGLPTIGVRFDIEKVGSALYGHTCWVALWRALDPSSLEGTYLYEGDTRATLNNTERVFCIALQNVDVELIVKVKQALAACREVVDLGATPMFLDGRACEREPLSEAGRVDASGQITGRVGTSYEAFGDIIRERRGEAEAKQPAVAVPKRNERASERTKELPDIVSLKELQGMLKSRFASRCSDSYFYLTPEELCDIADKYEGLVEVYWLEGSCGLSNDMLRVVLCWNDKRVDGVTCTGLFPFSPAYPSQEYCKSNGVDVTDWGIRGEVAVNFQGQVGSPWSSYRKREEATKIDSRTLWRKLFVRRQQLQSGPNNPASGSVAAEKADQHPITTQCPNRECRARYRVSQEYVGGVVRCKRCRTRFRVRSGLGELIKLGEGGSEPSLDRKAAAPNNNRSDCKFYSGGNCEAGEGNQPCSFVAETDYQEACSVYKAFEGTSGLRSCSSCGTQWRSLVGAVNDFAMFADNVNIGVIADPRELAGLTCVECGQSYCKQCLGMNLPKKLQGGHCPACGGQLDVRDRKRTQAPEERATAGTNATPGAAPQRANNSRVISTAESYTVVSLAELYTVVDTQSSTAASGSAVQSAPRSPNTFSKLASPAAHTRKSKLANVPKKIIDLRSEEEKKIEKDAKAGRSLGDETDRLIRELVDVGQTEGFLSTEPGGKFDENLRNIRARAIGERLNQLGGMELMQAAYYRVLETASIGSAVGLEAAWGYIGDWRP